MIADDTIFKVEDGLGCLTALCRTKREAKEIRDARVAANWGPFYVRRGPQHRRGETGTTRNGREYREVMMGHQEATP